MNTKISEVEVRPLRAALHAVSVVALAGVLGGGWLLVLDRLAALSAGRPPLGVAGYKALAAGLTGTQAALAAVALLLIAGRWGLKRAPRWVRVVLGALTFGGALAWPMHQVAGDLASGDWIAKQSWVGWFRYGLLAAGICAGVVVGALHSLDLKGRWAKVWPALLLLGSLGASAADARVLPGLYPLAHVFLAGAAGTLGYLAWLRVLGALRARWWVSALGVLALAALVAAPFGWRAWSPKARAALLVGSPIAQTVLPIMGGGDASALLRQALMALDLDVPDAGGRAPVQAPVVHPDWNIMVVVVDTLRADALPPGRGAGRPFSKPGDTPHLDGWLERAQVFSRAYAQASRTQFSMPPMMRSGHPFEATEALGPPVAEVMAARGRTPIAVVPQYFITPMDKRVAHLLEGYSDVGIFETENQKAWFGLFKGALDRVKGQTFFAWVHFYGMHKPGYAGRRLKRADGPWQKRYGRSLRWLDGQMGLLFAELKARGLDQNTVVVLASDHGENLGENGKTGHGGSVIERQVRVPLAIYVPGRAGAVVDTLVGNIDILPTVLDLVGAPPVPSHRGRSLRALMDDPQAAWGEAYSLTNGNGSIQALVDGTDKLVFYRKVGSTLRYDLATDPEEQENLFDAAGAVDQRLAMRLLMRNGMQAQRLMRADKAGISRQMVARHLAALTPEQANAAGTTLSFLLGLVAQAPTAEELLQVERLFMRGDDGTRVRIMGALFKVHGRTLGELLKRRLKAVAGTPAELALLAGLADGAQRQFERPFVSKQVLAAAKAGDAARLEAWLRLTRPWAKQDRYFGAGLHRALRWLSAPDRAPNGPLLKLVLGNLSTMKVRGRSLTAPSSAVLLLPLLRHADPLVAVEAARALGANGQPSSAEPLRAMLLPEVEVRVRRAALKALVQLVGPLAVPDLVRMGADHLLVVDAVQLLGRLGPKAKVGRAFLRKTARSHPMGFAKREAKKALRLVNARAPGAKGTPKRKPAKRRAKRPAKKPAKQHAH